MLHRVTIIVRSDAIASLLTRGFVEVESRPDGTSVLEKNYQHVPLGLMVIDGIYEQRSLEGWTDEDERQAVPRRHRSRAYLRRRSIAGSR